MAFSRAVAILGGIVLPLIETYRRWHQLGNWRMAPAWLDDWLIGGFLLYAAWRTREGAPPGGRQILVAAWGFACGMGLSSFIAQLANLEQADSSGASSALVAAIKGLMLGLGISALSSVLRSDPERG